MRVIDGQTYPVNYEKTLENAKRETAIPVAIECVDEVERRWVNLLNGVDYCMADLKKETLMSDIEILLMCCVTFINRIDELSALVQHKKWKGPPRELRRLPPRSWK